ncbi:complement component receptor 1-like protein [Uloborus diversus]|uniref:complement component receptor 1-like protein n=1 Tax=Uloborus diversus TaxID=327109 RepID=UPI0024091A68|nr:complement component receptor 1-like protein [Uloborus diversus]
MEYLPPGGAIKYEIYETVANCSVVKTYDTCPVKCKYGGKMSDDGSYIRNITCFPNGTYTALPVCTCKPLVLLEGMRLNKSANLDCDSKKPRENCFVECTEGYTAAFTDKFECMDTTKWRGSGSCRYTGSEIHICKKLDLGSEHAIEGPCVPKLVGESCTLKCISGGPYVDGAIYHSVMCMGIRFWREAPHCTCPLPVLSDGLELDVERNKDCLGRKPLELCYVRCRPGFKLRRPEKNFIECMHEAEWSTDPYGISRAQCDYVGSSIGYCAQPTLSGAQELASECLLGFKDDSCAVKCKAGATFQGNIVFGYTICLGRNMWSKLPACHCPPAESVGLFKGGLELDITKNKHCNDVAPNKYCYVKCKRDFALRAGGREYIACETKRNRNVWNTPPVCEYRGALASYCLQPVLPQALDFDSDCALMKPEESCRLKCKGGGRFLSGKHYISIKCKGNNTWEELIDFKDCACPSPLLTGSVTLRKDMNSHCDGVSPGGKCWLSCLPGFTLRGHNYTACTFDDTVQKDYALFKWSPLPYCDYTGPLEQYCANPTIPTVLEFEGECSLKGVSEACTLKCRRGGRFLKDGKQFDYIHCIKHGKWNDLVDFIGCSCPPPKLNDLLAIDTDINADCDFVAPGQYCYLKCPGDHHVRGYNYIKCLSDNTWSYQPSCAKGVKTCVNPPALLLGQALLPESACSNKRQYETCTIACYSIAGWSYVTLTCFGDDAWSKPPKCQCQPPSLSSAAVDETRNPNVDCRELAPGNQCWLKCPPGQAFEANDYIACRADEDVGWDPESRCVPLCSPFPFHLTQGLALNEPNCDRVLEGRSCRLRCEPGYVLNGRAWALCRNGEWVGIPSCAWGG